MSETDNRSLTELFPIPVDGDIDLRRYRKIPIGELTALGTGMFSVANAFETFANGAGGSGLYYVTVPNDGTMMQFKDGSGFLGSVKGENGGVGGGQARLNQLPCDPTMIFMAATMFCMHMKLNDIQETQNQILRFLELKEKAELRANIIVLSDIIENYKYNWNNKQYLNNHHMKVLDIKQKSEQSILFAISRIREILGKKKLLHVSIETDIKIKKLNDTFEDYQMALYTYAMASYVETMLLKNFEKDYMDGIANKIEDYSIKYRELYTECYNLLEDFSDRSIDNIIFENLAKASKAAGEAIARIPVISSTEIDESLIAVSEILGDSDNVIRDKKLSALVSKQSSYVTPFVDNIKLIGKLHEKPLNIMFDKDNLYVEKQIA